MKQRMTIEVEGCPADVTRFTMMLKSAIYEGLWPDVLINEDTFKIGVDVVATDEPELIESYVEMVSKLNEELATASDTIMRLAEHKDAE